MIAASAVSALIVPVVATDSCPATAPSETETTLCWMRLIDVPEPTAKSPVTSTLDENVAAPEWVAAPEIVTAPESVAAPESVFVPERVFVPAAVRVVLESKKRCGASFRPFVVVSETLGPKLVVLFELSAIASLSLR